jgi:DNA recombination protein RmuC
MTTAVIGMIVGAGLGALIAYFLTKGRAQTLYLAKLSEAEKQTAAADATAAQLMGQVQEKNSEVGKLREQLATEQKARTTAETMLEDERKLLADEKKLLQDTKTNLASAFQGLAAQALVENNKAFLELANQSFSELRSDAVADIKTLVDPLTTALETDQTNLQTIESARQQAYGEMKATLSTVGQTQELLKQETSNLVTALHRPHVRGRWGELTLRRVAELTGMSEHCDFEEQITINAGNGQLRPDMIIHLPKDVVVPVDAKVPLDAYLDAVAATTEEERKRHLKRHAAAVRERMKTLSSKEYESQFQNTPGVTVLFLPSDAFLSAALENDPPLLEDAMQKKVVIATPVSVFSLLKAVAYGWQQEAVAKNAQTISDLGKQLYDRIQIIWEHLDTLRDGLIRAVEAFDATVGSLESRILPSVRRFKELGATTDVEIDVMEPIARPPRALSARSASASSEGEKTSG